MIKRCTITLTGTSPLLMHNVRLADPQDDYVRRIREITGKGSKNKTDDDHVMLSRLEFEGGLYMSPDGSGPFIPTGAVIGSVCEAAGIRRLGTKMRRALIPTGVDLALEYIGPRDAEGLWTKGFIDKRAIGVNRNSKIMRTRPMFPNWSVVGEFLLETEMVNWADLVWALNLAGHTVGVMDGRRIGMGRFRAEATDDGDVA